jgi:hypothetical protein
MTDKQKHLEFIQAVIARMGSNLFLLKGWTVTLIAGLFALSSKESNSLFFFFAYVPTALFWCLDGYFLAQERRFRALYDAVRKLDEEAITYSMDIGPFADLPRNSWRSAMLSRTLVLYYGGLCATMLGFIYLLTN